MKLSEKGFYNAEPRVQDIGFRAFAFRALRVQGFRGLRVGASRRFDAAGFVFVG